MRKYYLLTVVLVFVLSIAMAFSMGCLGVYIHFSKDLPSFTKIKDYKPNLVTTLYAADGQILGYLYREKRFLVSLEEVPKHLVRCFLAAEDDSFYSHEGLDLAAIFRATLINLKNGGIVQGGSTITQQIIKQILLDSTKKYERKIKEAILAFQLENFLSKDEILTVYLNQAFFGAGAYGVEAGARTYFGKHVGDLTLAESALLAGLPKAPSNYNPFHRPQEARKRQMYVLNRLRALKWISQEKYDQAVAEKLDFKTMPEPSWGTGAYYMEEVRRWLIDYLSKENMQLQNIKLDRYGEDAVYESGLHVYTAVKLDHQKAAEKALRDGLAAATKRRGWRGADKKLSPSEFRDFLADNPVNLDDLKPGDWVKTLVMDVDGTGATVKVGDYDGFISAESMKWTWRGSPDQIVKPGDMIWASLRERILPPKDAGTSARKVLPLALEQKPKVQGALVSIEPPTGNVVALVGGFDFEDSQFNRATQARRQPGSAFKPIVYSAALDHGFRPTSVIMDSPISIGAWSPKNYGNKYNGPMTLTNALVKSKNVVTVRIAARLGIRNVIKRARRLGLEGEFPPYLPISLGAQVFTPINLARAYTAFARGGSYVKPRFVLSIKKAWGEEIFRSSTESVQAISPQNAYTMSTILQQVVLRGTGVRARVINRPVAGKTGTTNEEKDAWFIGFSPYLLTACYVGFDQVRPMGRSEAGSRAALPIWLKYRLAVEAQYPVENFSPPHGKQQKYVPGYKTNPDGYDPYSPDPSLQMAQLPSNNELTVSKPRPKRPRSASTNEELLKQLY